MSLTDQFAERKIQRNLACFLEPHAEYSPEQFAEMKKPFYGIMNAAKLRMNDKTEILFFTEETPLLMQLFQTINEDSVVEALGGLYYHLAEIAESDILDSRNLMVDPEYIYFEQNREVSQDRRENCGADRYAVRSGNAACAESPSGIALR